MMKNQYISIPLDSFGTIAKCLSQEQFGKFVQVMLDSVQNTGLAKVKDSDILAFLAVTVGANKPSTGDEPKDETPQEEAPAEEEAEQEQEETAVEPKENEDDNENLEQSEQEGFNFEEQ